MPRTKNQLVSRRGEFAVEGRFFAGSESIMPDHSLAYCSTDVIRMPSKKGALKKGVTLKRIGIQAMIVNKAKELGFAPGGEVFKGNSPKDSPGAGTSLMTQWKRGRKMKVNIAEEKRHKIHLPTQFNYLFSTIAPCAASLFTNPMDVAKTRMQLQGQLANKGAAVAIVYTSTVDCLWKTARAEGLVGLQRGLPTMLLREAVYNFFRLGLYEPILHTIHDKDEGPAPISKRMIAGAISGVIGSLSVNPLEIVKTRLQSRAVGGLAVGSQYNYRGTFDAISSIMREAGFKGLWKGASAAAMRSAIGSSTMLTTFTLAKDGILHANLAKDSAQLDIVCSLMAGFISTLSLNPVDVVRTRLYNQHYDKSGMGSMYNGVLDAIGKISTREGPGAFLKGFTANYLFRGPQIVLSFLFLEQLKRATKDQITKKERTDELRSIFGVYDSRGRGFVDARVLSEACARAIPRPVALATMSEDSYKELIGASVASILRNKNVSPDSIVDFPEFLDIADQTSYAVRRREEEQVFSALDADHNGALGADDIKAALAAVAPLDIQKGLDPAEYDSMLYQSASQMIKKADRDGDGAINLDDFSTIADHVSPMNTHRVLSSWLKTAGVAYN